MLVSDIGLFGLVIGSCYFCYIFFEEEIGILNVGAGELLLCFVWKAVRMGW